MRVYCTYFDSGYAARGVAMIESLRGVGEHGSIYVVCFDDAAASAVELLHLEDVVVVPIAALEASDPELAAAKPSRSRVEYYFTSTASVVSYVMAAEPAAEWVTYLDADLWFFSSPNDVYKEQEEGSVGIIAHGYRNRDRWREKFGVYNVGWVSFRNDEIGHACASWWRERSIEWCFDKPEPGRFADQGYLDQFADVVPRTVVVRHPGANLAPWNLATRTLKCDDGAVEVDGRPLVFFHFHGLQQQGQRWYFAHARYGATTTTCVRENLYRPYIAALTKHHAGASVTGPRRRGSLLGATKHAAVRMMARARGDTIIAS